MSSSADFTSIRFPITSENLSEWDITNDSEDPEKNISDKSWEIDIPFSSFPRTDRLGRIADWASPIDGGHASSVIAASRRSKAKFEEEETGWTFTAERPVGNKRSAPKLTVPVRLDGNRSNRTGGGRNSTTSSGKRSGGGGGWGQRYSERQVQRKRDPSIMVSSEWRILEEIEFSRLAKLQLNPDDAEPISTVGQAYLYDRTADKISVKADKVLHLEDCLPAGTDHNSLEDDRLLMRLAKEHRANIVCSDVAAAMLMTSQRSVIPWDVLIIRRDSLLIIDQRPESQIGIITVNENAADSPSDDIMATFAAEATKLRNYLPQFLSKGMEKFGEGSVAVSGSPIAMRYTKIDLGDDNIAMVRSTVRMVTHTPEGITPMPITPLLEQEDKVGGIAAMDWRTKLDAQRGAVLAHEIRNNGAQLSRSVFSALLSASGLMKLAYVTKGKCRLTLLGLQEYEPYELALQMNLNVPNGFGIFRVIIDLVRKQPNGDYLLMRDPNKPLLRLYKMTCDEIDAAIDELVPATAELHISDLSSPSDLSDIEP